jgi:anti-sigma B factor antagonist
VADVIAPTNLDWEPFRCEVIPDRDAVRVKPIGELDMATVEQVARPLRELRAVGFREIVLDLSELSFIDSSGIKMILDARDASLENGTGLKVLPGPPAVQRAFEVTGLTPLLFP